MLTGSDAIDDASDGDVITVCAGTYDPIEVNDHDLTIVGADGADVTFIAGLERTAVDVAGYIELDLSGFTMYGESTTGATALHVKDADVVVHHARFADNYNGAIVLLESGSLSWDHVVVEDNAYSGSGTLIVCSSATGWLEIQHSIFRNNRNVEVLRLLNGSFHNNLVVNNTISSMIGIGMIGDYGGTREMYNNTIYDMTGTGYWAVSFSGTGNDFRNNIIAETASYQDTLGGTVGNASYNDLWNNTPGNTVGGTGTGNLQLDPEFTDPAAGDFTLKSSSPLVNRGDPDAASEDADGSRNDVGAYGGPGGAW